MSEDEIEQTPRTFSGALLGAIAVAVLLGIGGLIWCFTLNGRLSRQETAMTEANQHAANLEAELRETNARLKVATDALETRLGLTQKEVDARADELVRRQSAENTRLETAEKKTAQQVSDVSTEVSSVKTDVGGVKTDVAKTQTDLAGAIAQLTSMKGDLSDHSSLIARNHDELEVLKHKGDRNYYEFTLEKGQRKPVSTVSLELRKADPKKNIFNLNVISDDKTVPKNNRGVNEPLQFYSGKDPMLFEIVVNVITSKNEIKGYLSTPKNAPVPPTVQ